MFTKVLVGEFNKQPMLKIWKCDPETGEKIGDKAYITMGANKVREMVKHVDSLHQFLELADKHAQKAKEEVVEDKPLGSF